MNDQLDLLLSALAVVVASLLPSALAGVVGSASLSALAGVVTSPLPSASADGQKDYLALRALAQQFKLKHVAKAQ